MQEIRWASLQDAKQLGSVHADSYRDAYKEMMPVQFLQKLTASGQAAYFERTLTEAKEQIAIMLDNEKAVGCMIIKIPDGDQESSAEISAIYLLKQVQGLGYGNCLLDWGLDRLKELGCKKVILWVLQENMNAIRFYERQSFAYDGTEREIFRGKSLKQLRYYKEL